jgi:hypothetical protein
MQMKIQWNPHQGNLTGGLSHEVKVSHTVLRGLGDSNSSGYGIASAELCQVNIKRIDQDLYKTSEGIYIETQ